jgi:hypothetical protein
MRAYAIWRCGLKMTILSIFILTVRGYYCANIRSFIRWPTVHVHVRDILVGEISEFRTP